MAQDNQADLGAAIRRKLMGDERMAEVKGAYQAPAMTAFIDVCQETIYSKLWTRPGLDLKTRTLICVVSDVATGQTGVLPEHLRYAMRQGWTEEELTETLLHLLGYVGAPFVREGIIVAAKVFAEVRPAKA